MGMALTDLRQLARFFCRNAGDSSAYSDSNIDLALQLAADEWCRIVRVPRTVGSLTLTAGSNALPAAVSANWSPEFHIGTSLYLAGQLVNPNMDFTDYNTVAREAWIHGDNGTISSNASTSCLSAPRMYGYLQNSTAANVGICFPTPDQPYVMFQEFRDQFTSWVSGGTCSGFNLPDEHLRVIATDGACAYLQQNEPKNAAIAAAARVRFENKAHQIKGRDSGGRNGNVSIRDDPDDFRHSSRILVG